MTPEAFAAQQRKRQSSEIQRTQLTRSVNLSGGKGKSKKILEQEQTKLKKEQQGKSFKTSLEEVDTAKKPETMTARQIFEAKTKGGGSSEAQEKLKQTIRQSVRGRYLREIKEVAPSVKEQFWKEFQRRSGSCYSALAIKGWRPYMEDTMDTFHTRKENLDQLFAVYDGHGGMECSMYCESYMLKRIAMHSELNSDPKAALTDSFLRIDESFAKQAEKSGSAAGTTATVLYVCPEKVDKETKMKYYLSYVGDSRAILVYKDGSAVPISQDHHLTRKDELERVKSANGTIRYDEEFDETLVYNVEADRGLAVTRSIGDADFKPIVTASPETNEGYITEDCAFVCLASDGLWAKISNSKVGEILTTHGQDEGIDTLANLANARSVFDNITIMVVDCDRLRKNLL